MSEDRSQDKLMERIVRLLAMANHPGSNEHEAQIAAAKVQEMLAEHNLTLAQVESSGARGASAYHAEKREQAVHKRSAMYKYQQNLMGSLSKNNFCYWRLDKQSRADPRGTKTVMVNGEPVLGRDVMVHIIVGRQSNVVVTLLTYDYLVDAMDRYLPYVGMAKRGKEALIWLDGCTERLTERLVEKRRQMEEESRRKAEEEQKRQQHPSYAGSGNALVVLSDLYGTEEDLNADFLAGDEPGTRARRTREYEAKLAQRKIESEAQIAKLMAEGVPEEVAWWMAQGYSRQEAEKIVHPEPEPVNERRWRRSRATGAQEDIRWRAEWNRRSKEEARRNHPAYKAGRDQGGKIGLDTQVGSSKRDRLGKR